MGKYRGPSTGSAGRLEAGPIETGMGRVIDGGEFPPPYALISVRQTVVDAQTGVGMRLVCAATWCLVLIGAHGSLGGAEALHFIQRVLELHPAPDETTVTAEFPFTNQTTHQVAILTWGTSCGCTVANLTKTLYGKGESGLVTAVFTIGDYSGNQSKSITLATNDPSEFTIVLTMRIVLPPGPVLSPAICEWTVGGNALPQVITISIPTECPHHILSATCRDQRLRIQFSSAGPDRATLTLTPVSTTVPFSVAIDLLTEATTVYHAFATVKPAQAGDGATAPPSR